ncbi:MAG: DUF2807 domain-containing protein [Anaerolineales bacterium]
MLTKVTALSLATLACGVTINMPNLEKGNGNVTEEIREVDSFSEISFSGIGEIVVTLGDEESLTIEAEENLLPYLETYNRGDTLVIEIQDDTNITPTEPIHFDITVVSLDAIDVSGVGNVSLPALEADRFTIAISGIGDVEIDSLVAERFTADMSGLGDLTINGGEVDSQEIDISGGGKYSAAKLESLDAEISVSGVGSATVRASETLDVSISGGGDVNYYGNPQVISDISGLGDLNNQGD